MVDDSASVPWAALRQLYATLEGLPGVGLARATKILHKKRPNLVPILDQVVVRYLESVERPATGSLAVRGVALTRSYHRELHRVLPALAFVRHELDRRGFSLSECRLLDIYLWAYSGTYQPLWQRDADRPPRSHFPPGRPAAPDDPVAVAGVERFVNDDARYLDWL